MSSLLFSRSIWDLPSSFQDWFGSRKVANGFLLELMVTFQGNHYFFIKENLILSTFFPVAKWKTYLILISVYKQFDKNLKFFCGLTQAELDFSFRQENQSASDQIILTASKMRMNFRKIWRIFKIPGPNYIVKPRINDPWQQVLKNNSGEKFMFFLL